MLELVIQTENLSKSFGKTRAVDNVNLSIHSGEIYGLVGPDGAGKTTLMRLLCGALHMDNGKATIAGYDITNQAEHARQQIGYLAQRFAMYEELTVWENLQFFAEVRGLPSKEWVQRGKEILEFVGLEEFAGRRAGQLSGGMKQKLGLASALVHRPRILLLDEPTTGVDPVTRQGFWQLIIRVVAQENVTVLISTPYMDEASRCMRLGFMRQGKIFLEGKPRDLCAKLTQQIYELQGRPLQLLRQIAAKHAAVENVQMFGGRLHLRIKRGQAKTLGRLKSEIRSAGAIVDHLKPIDPQLEDVFIALVEK
ncbi:MAG: ABC transporter ATP-binding protein [Anaerolineae bacterium]|nr:ABC transporter ATP-binding protein [Anaerolineae bacterium]